MTRHERTIIAAEEVPSIDAVDDARGINPRFDVAQIATRGHVNAARIEAITKAAILPAIIAAGLTLAVSFGVIGHKGFSQKQFSLGGMNGGGWLQQALTYDPNTYFDLGGGLKGGPELAWLGSFAPTPESLKVADYAALIEAVKADSAKHGVDAVNWEAVGGLKVAPVITRPHKFGGNAQHLKNGVVAVPEGDDKIVVAAYVEAKWAFAVVLSGRCVALVGPVPEDCSDHTRGDGGFDSQTTAFLTSLKPKD